MGERWGREAGGEMLMALLPRVVYIMSHSTCAAVFYELVSCSPCVTKSVLSSLSTHTHTPQLISHSHSIFLSLFRILIN